MEPIWFLFMCVFYIGMVYSWAIVTQRGQYQTLMPIELNTYQFILKTKHVIIPIAIIITILAISHGIP